MNLFKSFASLFSRRPAPSTTRAKSSRCQLMVETLEDRNLMSVNMVAHDLLLPFTPTQDIRVSSAAALTVTTVTSTLNPSLPPSGNFDLSHWRLTLPTGSAGNPDNISTSSLTAGYTSQYFYTGADGAMVFWSPVTGVTTSGSTFPRTEFRETKSDGSLYNWNVTDGTATLNATLAVTQVPSTGKVVVGQIHDNGAGGIKSRPLIMLVYNYNSGTHTGSLVLEVRATPTSSTSTKYTVATNIPLNTKFSYQLQLQADKTLSVQINGVTQYSAAIDSSWLSQGLYFKAGAYVLDNSGTDTEGGRVSFYALTAIHK